MPEPCKFLSLDSCQQRFLWTHKEVDLAMHPVVGLVLQLGDAEKLQALGFESLDFFFSFRSHGGNKTLVDLELALVKLMVLHSQILLSLAIDAIAEAIPMRISAEEVSSLYRVAPRYVKLVTSSNVWPLILIYALTSFVLLAIILLFSVLTPIPYAVVLSTSLLVRS